MPLAGPQLMSLRRPIGTPAVSVFCPEGSHPGAQPVLAVAQPDGVVEGAAVADAQPLAPEVEAVAVPAVVVEVVPASPLLARVVRSEAEVASLVATTVPA
jgi:hypothetical protein